VVIVPESDIAAVAEAHRRLLRALDGLTDQHVRAPSLLPGWTVGHVLAHVARNADSHVRRAGAAVRGEVVDQYEGGSSARNADIEAGARRPAADIRDDVARTARATEEAWRSLPIEAWTGRSRDANGLERPLFELPSRRWQEIEVHLVDMDLGVSHRDWPTEFVVAWLARTRERTQSHLASLPSALHFDHPADELAWMYGRLARADLPAPPPWG
jgi:maleylpyruvate isomerase